MMINKQLLKRSFIPLTILFFAGCGTAQHKVAFQDDYSPSAHTKIVVGEVTNATAKTFDVNVEQMFADALTLELSKEAMLWDNEPDAKLVIDSEIVEYAKGNAFKRWLLPGWGSTMLTIKCDLKDGDKLVGSLETRRTVFAGGGFTIGAWETIFTEAAKDIVMDLRSRLPQ